MLIRLTLAGWHQSSRRVRPLYTQSIVIWTVCQMTMSSLSWISLMLLISCIATLCSRELLKWTLRSKRFWHVTYCHHSTLQFGDFSISSKSGSQQGDPLRGLLFFLAIHLTLLSLSSPLSWVHGRHNHWYSGLECILVSFWRGKIERHLTVTKCEVITKVHHQFNLEFHGFVNTHPNDACLLGVP